MLLQPEIGANIAGILPVLKRTAGFEEPLLHAMFLDYRALFLTLKSVEAPL